MTSLAPSPAFVALDQSDYSHIFRPDENELENEDEQISDQSSESVLVRRNRFGLGGVGRSGKCGGTGAAGYAKHDLHTGEGAGCQTR